ncbi:hypothetical protein NP493_868g03012 [Ridgeia piscesae]|uniref:Uncharacterized protein n=1 Tax=Ridgeia piscesae TaxID=27915 RepID=A0AAD9KLA3_RIDPI|nr:hypothetical protein NP493_868g03012 [Ridgeia piscesae]
MLHPAHVTSANIHNPRNISLLCLKAMFPVISVRSCETLDVCIYPKAGVFHQTNCIGSGDTIRDMEQLFEYNIFYLS